MSSFHSASLPHDSAALYVTGQAQFIDDIALPADTVHVALGLSDIAHGIITDMDFSSVLQADGVIGVLTHHDIQAKMMPVLFLGMILFLPLGALIIMGKLSLLL